MRSTLSPPGRLTERMLYTLSNYNFQIIHKKSGEILNADFLSRHPTGEPSQEELDKEDELKDLTISAITIQQGNLKSINWKEAQENDNNLKKVREWKLQDSLPPGEELKKLNTDLQRLSKIFDSIKLDPETNILMVETAPNEHMEIDKFRILLPKECEHQVIRRFHSQPQQGHFGVGITANRILNHFWMSRPYPQITEFISRCLECQLKKKSIINKIRPQRTHMYTNKTNYPLSVCYLDHFGPLKKTPRENEYILTIRDNFTRFVWLIPVRDIKTTTVAQKLEEEVFKYFGLVDCLLSDNHKSFTSKIMQEICAK